MVDEIRRQLDALMGTNRDEPDANPIKHFSDRDVCKYYLAGLCPHELFINTKKELGTCPNLHSEPLKYVYEEERKKKDWGYERRLATFLDELVRDCNRTIERQERKLKENEAEKLENDPLSKQIAELQANAEKFGEDGNVDEYMRLTSEIESLKQKRHQQQVLQLPAGAAGEVIQQHGTQSQEQKLRVCEICGCYLSKFDSEKRLTDHFMGKLHMGYLAVREKLDELKKEGYLTENKDSEKGESTVRRRSRERTHRDEPYSRKEKEDDKGRDRERERERDRDRDGDRRRGDRGDRGRRSRERDRSRERRYRNDSPDRRDRYSRNDNRHKKNRYSSDSRNYSTNSPT